MHDETPKETNHGRICPWWIIHIFDNPVRKLFQNPGKILAGLVHEGDKVLDIGCGIGYFTIPLAQMAGTQGEVFAVDLQQQMLNGLQRRARRQGLDERIHTHCCTADSLGLHERVNFVLALWMVHEVPDQRHLFQKIHALLTPGGQFLLAEPKLHVSARAFAASVALARDSGLEKIAGPEVGLSHACLFRRETDNVS